MAWSGEHRTFVIEEFVKNGESVVVTQRSFRRHFSLNRHDPVPTEKTIHSWISNFRQTSSALHRRRSGRPRTRTAQENVTAWQTHLSNLPDVPSESTHLPCTSPLQVSIEFCTGHSICIPTR